MDDRHPLSALLSQVLVAFTIEFDNEFEHSIPHRTTNHGSTGGSTSVPWLVSMVIWMQLMRFVPDQGIDGKELSRRTGLSPKAFRTWLIRLSQWWGYVTVSERLVRPTLGGMKALEAWRPLTDIIQTRWQNRFGNALLDQLLEVMQSIVKRLGVDYPDYLPVLGYELLTDPPDPTRAPRGVCSMSADTLPTLLSKLLLAFATEFERASNLSLALAANVLRLAGDKGIPVRDLPRLSGVSKEAIAMALRRAGECGLGVVERDRASSRKKIFVLTPAGRRGRERYDRLVRSIETGWAANYGREKVGRLRGLLETIVGRSDCEPSRLFEGLKPYPEGWRASVPRLSQLPHYPMVLHRGGFPDGS
jgi:DNA-binding MarR family transcriptional regulator